MKSIISMQENSAVFIIQIIMVNIKPIIILIQPRMAPPIHMVHTQRSNIAQHPRKKTPANIDEKHKNNIGRDTPMAK